MSNKVYKDLKRKRLTANQELAYILLDMINDDGGEQRFSQLIRNYGFVLQTEVCQDMNMYPVQVWRDEFNLEPDILLQRVQREYAKVFS